ncbi:MAG TPA: hypothetical protein VMH00_11245 [Candidatus Limnocylindrales bacterium]|nr:hypothetical protein [Candidatus Limnocylindrales bacterium]
MIASLIFLFSVGALAQFAVAYCRTLLCAYGKVELSEKTCEVTGLSVATCSPSDFNSLMELVRLAPPLRDDATEIRVVRVYRSLASLASKVVSPFSPQASQWFDRELARCSYFAAVTLDRRLATTAH